MGIGRGGARVGRRFRAFAFARKPPTCTRDGYEEAQRIIRIIEEGRISLEEQDAAEEGEKLTRSKLAKKIGLKTAELTEQQTASRLLEQRAGKHYLTEAGTAARGEFRMSPLSARTSFCPQYSSRSRPAAMTQSGHRVSNPRSAAK